VDEIISMNRRVLEGIEVDDDTLALDVIASVGPGGDFLKTKHTRAHVHALQWKPTMFNRDSRANWEAEGSLDLREKARRKALAILADHEPLPPPPGFRKTMDDRIEAFVSSGS
jgi:trimethylamine--corrinoid protein Co-methyltransferase